jgi:hypothetical protein
VQNVVRLPFGAVWNTMIIETPTPNLTEVASGFEGNIGRYIEFDYESVPECQRPLTPSKEADRMNTVYKDPPGRVKAHTDSTQGRVWQTQDGNWVITLRTMMRLAVDTGMFKWRAYRLEGIRLHTVRFNSGPRGKVRMFPNARATR